MQKRNFEERYLAFNASVLGLLPELPRNPMGAHIRDQLFRSVTAVSAHLQEARGARSRADFIYRMALALKEMRDLNYWLSLTRDEALRGAATPALFKEAGELTAILSQWVNILQGGNPAASQISDLTPAKV